MLVVSLKYSPVYSSHMYALYLAGKDLKINITFFCHIKYYLDLIGKGINPSNIISYTPKNKLFLDECINRDWRGYLNLIKRNGTNTCFVMNPCPANPIFLSDYAKIIGGKTFLWLHEPHKTISELFQYGTKGFYYLIAMLIARWSVKNIKYCILPSQYALNKFKKFYPSMANRCFLLPLAFSQDTIGVQKKLYFSFIGHVNKGKGIEPFLSLVEYCWQNELKYNFQIVSSTLCEPWLTRAKKSEGKNLKIISKSSISDKEIATAIATSYAILCFYTTVTQSSVVANAMMQGTAVIASKVGSLPEVIVVGKTGYFVDNVYNHAKNVKLLELCISKKNEHKNYCLEEFQNSYSINAVKPYLSKIATLDD